MSDAALVQFPLGGGIDESVDDYRTPITRMRVASNCRFPAKGLVAKRYGFAPVGKTTSTGATLSTLKRVFSCAGDVVVTDGYYAYSYSSTAGRWYARGRVSPCTARRSEFVAGNLPAIQQDPISGAYIGQLICNDAAELNGYRLVVWAVNGTSAQGGGIFAAVIDTASGDVVSPTTILNATPPTALAGPQTIRALAVNGKLLAVYTNTNGIFGRSWDTTARTWSSESTLASSGGAATWSFDACENVGSTDFVFVYNDATANVVKASRMNTGFGTLAGPTTVVSGLTGAADVAARCQSSDLCWIAYVQRSVGTIKLGTYTPSTMAQNTAPFTAMSFPGGGSYVLGVERLGVASAAVAASPAGFSGGLQWCVTSTTASLLVFGSNTLATSQGFNWTLASRPFLAANGLLYVAATWNNLYVGTHVLLELDQNSSDSAYFPALPAATYSVRQVNSNQVGAAFSRACNVTGIGAPGTSQTTMCFATNSSGNVAPQFVTFNFADPALYKSVTLGQTGYIAGGTLLAYDGQRTVECGFITPATIASVPSTSTAGGSMGNHLYHYAAAARQMNAKGEIARSAPLTVTLTSVDFSASGTGTNQATLRLYNLCSATYRQDATGVSNPVTLELYRTSYIGGVETPQLYLCNVAANDLTSKTQDVVDKLSDASIQSNPLLYTFGNALESDAPPSIRDLITHNQRLFGLGDDGTTIWYTTAYVPGEQPRWNDALKLSIPSGNGDLVALASFEGRLLAFTKTDLFVFTGDGPNDTGAGETWSAPVRMPFGVGCTDPRAIAVCPLGVVFLSLKGLYLFDRSSDAVWLGERIQRTLTSYPNIAAITHYESDGYVLLSMRASDSDGAAGIVMMWDYRKDVFAPWTVYTDGNGFNSGFRSLASVNGTLYALAVWTDGTSSIATYAPGTWRDGTSAVFVNINATTGWVTAGEMQGYARLARVQVLGVAKSSHSLSVATYPDYSSTSDHSSVWSYATITAFPNTPLEQVRLTPSRQKVQAVSVEIRDSAFPDTGTGEAVVIEGILLKLRGKRGEYKRLGTSQQG